MSPKQRQRARKKAGPPRLRWNAIPITVPGMLLLISRRTTSFKLLFFTPGRLSVWLALPALGTAATTPFPGISCSRMASAITLPTPLAPAIRPSLTRGERK